MGKIRRKSKRRALRASAALIALVVLVVLAYLVGSHRRTRKAKNPMVTMDAGVMTIRDYDAWFEVLPRAIRTAMRRNESNAEVILADVFSTILPDETWPPSPGSPQRWQWTQMVEQTRALLEPAPRSPTPRKLQVVTPTITA